MFRAIWSCDICGRDMFTNVRRDNIPETLESMMEKFIWEIPHDSVDGCIIKYVVCSSCRKAILDPKSPEATSRPAD